MKGILVKLFGARERMARRRGFEDKEMPFLEHLEELRQTLVRIIITLIIVTIGAFVFRTPLMELIRRPVELAGLGASIELPKDITKQEWRKVQTLATTAESLDPLVREAFLQEALTDEEESLRLYVEALPVFNATLVLDKERREDFVGRAIATNPALRDTILKLVRENPGAKIDRQGNLIEMSALRPPEAFMLSLKISMLAGIILAFPLLLYFIAQFVFPGLTNKEKRAVLPAVGIGFGLFLLGATFAYWVVTPRVLEFFHGYADELGVNSEWRIGYYVSFVSQLVLIFGVSFELPVVVMTLVKLDLLGYQFMARNRSYAIIIIFTVAALITPTPDAPTLCLLAVPMVILYEICIWMAYFLDRRRRREEAEEEAERALYREKRAKAKLLETPPPGLPLGTVGRQDGDDTDVKDTDTEEGDNENDDAHFESQFAENDALRGEGEPQPPSSEESGASGGEPATGDPDHADPPVYEEGFGPGDSDDDSPDPYSSDAFHNEPYADNEATSDPDETPGSAESPESVDDRTTREQKEDEGEDPPASSDPEEPNDTPPKPD